MKKLFLILLLVGLVCLNCPIDTSQSVKFTITNNYELPIENANVVAHSELVEAVTDKNGNVILELEPGVHTVYTFKDGYFSYWEITVTTGTTPTYTKDIYPGFFSTADPTKIFMLSFDPNDRVLVGSEWLEVLKEYTYSSGTKEVTPTTNTNYIPSYDFQNTGSCSTLEQVFRL